MRQWTLVEYVGLLAAAFAAGAINAVAGGGSLISFPALVAVGLSLEDGERDEHRRALAGLRRRLLRLPRGAAAAAPPPARAARARASSARSSAPSSCSPTPDSAFDAIVPFLILFACALMALPGPARRVRRARTALALAAARTTARSPLLVVDVRARRSTAPTSAPALGIITLAFLSILLADDIQHSNALKGMLSLIINAVAVVYFALFGPVRLGRRRPSWRSARIAGGYLGVGVARRLGRRWLRIVVIAYGLVVVIVLFVK